MDNQMNFFFPLLIMFEFPFFKESLCVVLLYSGVELPSALGASLVSLNFSQKIPRL